jgi:hypothetical protein
VRGRLDRLLAALGLISDDKSEDRPVRKPDVMDLLDKLEAGDLSVDAVLKTIKGETDEQGDGTTA